MADPSASPARVLDERTPSDDGLDRWIRDVRGRVERGDLAGLRPCDLCDGTHHLPSETTITIMLNNLTDLDDPAGS